MEESEMLSLTGDEVTSADEFGTHEQQYLQYFDENGQMQLLLIAGSNDYRLSAENSELMLSNVDNDANPDSQVAILPCSSTSDVLSQENLMSETELCSSIEVLDRDELADSKDGVLQHSNSQSVILPSFVVIGGQTCSLKVDSESGNIVACPVTVSDSVTEDDVRDEVVSKRRQRGRPRKQPLPTSSEQLAADGQCTAGPSEQENNAAEGLLGLAADSEHKTGLKKKSVLSDVNVKPFVSKNTLMNIEVPGQSTCSVSAAQVQHCTQTKPRPAGSNRVQNFLANLGLPVKRGRGRPRRNPLSADELSKFMLPLNSSLNSESVLPTTDHTGEMQTSIVIEQEDGTEKHIVLSLSTSTVNTGETELMPATDSHSSHNSHVTPDQPSTVQIVIIPKKQPVKIGLRTSEDDLAKLRCRKCEFQGFYAQQLQQHLEENHGDELADLLRCKCCSYLCFSDDELVSHFKDSHPKCICNICGFMSEHSYIIKRHMQRHDTSSCECHICGRHYKDQYILKMHIKMRHMEPEVLFQCNICSKLFTRKAHLKRHLRIHNPDKPYRCPHCDYRGCERSDINKHILIHDSPHHECEVCGKTFRHIKNKELHMKRHRGQRDYKCMYCEFYGYTYTDIRKHQERKHTGAQICNFCQAVFKSEHLLQAHQLQCEATSIHTTLVASAGHDTEPCDVMQYVTDPSAAMHLVSDANDLLPSDSHITASGSSVNITISQLSDEGLNLMEVQMVDSENNSTEGDHIIEADGSIGFITHTLSPE